MRRLLAPATALALCLALPAAAWAQTAVSLQGRLGNKALLVVSGGAPRAVAPGETHQGVKVLSTNGDQAVVLVDGQRLTLRVGDAPVNLGATHKGEGTAGGSGGGNKVVLNSDGRGHFFADGRINNRQARFMVDTGATTIAMGSAEADRLGITYKNGRPVRMNTANGQAQGWLVKLNEVRVGQVTVYEVEAVVTQQEMPAILLGNSFLNRFDMQRSGQQMTLTKH